jgi:hypothetical protein
LVSGYHFPVKGEKIKVPQKDALEKVIKLGRREKESNAC